MVLKAARQEVLKEEPALAEIRLQLRQLISIRDQGAGLQEELDRYQQMVPQSPGEDQLIRCLQNGAAKSGLEFVQIQFEPRESTDKYVGIPFTAEFEGTFNSFVQFLAGLQKGSRIIHVQQFQVSKAGNSPSVVISISGSAFYSEKL